MKLKSFVILITSFLLMNVVHANDIKSINMDIYIDNNGNANIKETWVADLNSGTEGYKPYYNLGTSEIKDFKVKLDDREFTTIPNWNVDASFNSKSYKAGLHKIQDGYELCFGISKYGLNTYEMDYTITNFVVGLNDADMVYWTLIPHDLSDKPDKVYIKIYSDFKYEDTLDVWGYGNYGGLAYVYDGYIEMQHENELDSSEYMTILVKYPKGTFNTTTKIDEDFNYYYEMAEEGSTHYVKPEINNNQNIINDKKDIFQIVIYMIFYLIFILLGSMAILSFFFFLESVIKKRKYGMVEVTINSDIKNVKNAEYFRDIPCNKNIFEANWIAYQFKLMKKETNFLGAILLKWLKDKNIEKVNINNKNAYKFVNSDNLSDLEMKLYKMMVKASDDKILEKKEFVKWCRKNSSKILKWFDSVIDTTTFRLTDKKLISSDGFGKYVVKDKMKEYALQMSGLKNFLNDFSNIKDRESMEVMLLQEYLIYAQIFGIAKKIAKEFKDLYPDIITDDYFDNIDFANDISNSGIRRAKIINSRNNIIDGFKNGNSKADNYTSGGGGYSSSGGGGGSFGGGGGGGGGFR